MHLRLRTWIGFVCVIAGTDASCCPPKVPDVVLVAAPPLPTAGSSPASGIAPTVELDSVPIGHSAALLDLISRAKAIVLSDRFGEVLGRIEKLARRSGGTTVPGGVVLQQLLGNAPQRPGDVRYFEGAATCKYHGHGETARTGVDPTVRVASDLSVSTCVEPLIFTRLSSQANMACDVNTIVHEWSHAILSEDGEMLYTDGGHSSAPQPLVSYTIGAIAQCVYIERALGGRLPDDAMQSCIKESGTTTFDPNTCDDKWLEAWKSAIVGTGAVTHTSEVSPRVRRF